MKGWKDEGMKEWKDERIKGWKDEGMKGWRNEGMKGWRDERIKGWKDERMKGWKDGLLVELLGLPGVLLPVTDHIDKVLRQHKRDPGKIKQLIDQSDNQSINERKINRGKSRLVLLVMMHTINQRFFKN